MFFFFKWSVIYHKDSTLAGKHRHNIPVVNFTTVNHFKTKKGFLLHYESNQQQYVIKTFVLGSSINVAFTENQPKCHAIPLNVTVCLLNKSIYLVCSPIDSERKRDYIIQCTVGVYCRSVL